MRFANENTFFTIKLYIRDQYKKDHFHKINTCMYLVMHFEALMKVLSTSIYQSINLPRTFYAQSAFS